MKQYRMSMEKLQKVFRQRKYGADPEDLTIADMEATGEVWEGECFGHYFDRHKSVLDLYEEVVA